MEDAMGVKGRNRKRGTGKQALVYLVFVTRL